MDANSSNTCMFYTYVSFDHRPIMKETEHWYNETCPDYWYLHWLQNFDGQMGTMSRFQDTARLQISQGSNSRTCQWMTEELVSEYHPYSVYACTACTEMDEIYGHQNQI